MLLSTNNIVFTQTGALCGGAGQQASTVLKTCYKYLETLMNPKSPSSLKHTAPVPYTLQSPRVGPWFHHCPFRPAVPVRDGFRRAGFQSYLSLRQSQRSSQWFPDFTIN